MRISRKILTTFFLSFFFGAFLFAQNVLADAWWGYGYRSPEWILANGGSIIHFKIKGAGSSDSYKAVLYRDGKYVEVEFGKNGTFDDAKNGTYKVTAYKGGIGRKETYKGGKAIASVTVTVRPGETVSVEFSEKNKQAISSSNRPAKRIAVAPPVKKTPPPASVAPTSIPTSAPSAPITNDDSLTAPAAIESTSAIIEKTATPTGIVCTEPAAVPAPATLETPTEIPFDKLLTSLP